MYKYSKIYGSLFDLSTPVSPITIPVHLQGEPRPGMQFIELDTPIRLIHLVKNNDWPVLQSQGISCPCTAIFGRLKETLPGQRELQLQCDLRKI